MCRIAGQTCTRKSDSQKSTSKNDDRLCTWRRRLCSRPYHSRTCYKPSSNVRQTRGYYRVIERVEWDEFYSSFAWRQGEHIGMIGPTGCGKSTLMLSVLKKRDFVVALATKPKDPTLEHLMKQGYLKVEKWDRLDPQMYPKRILWPKVKNLSSALTVQKEV